MIVIDREGVAPMNEIMLIIAICNSIMNLIGLILRLKEIRQKNKSRSYPEKLARLLLLHNFKGIATTC